MKQDFFRCAIISIYPFPVGLAATNRIIAYSKGLIAQGCSVDVFIPITTDNQNSKNHLESNGVFQNISYYYTIGRYKNKYKLLRAISIISGYRKFIGFFNTIVKIQKLNKAHKYSCLIISNDDILNLFVYSLFALAMGIKSVFIFDEYPVPIRHKQKSKIPGWKTFLYKRVLKYLSAYISISQNLKRYYSNLYPKKTFILPLIVDISRFTEIEVSDLKDKDYICYMGNMELAKDDVDNIIRAFSFISSEHTSIDLHLYGEPNSSTKQYLRDLAEDLHVEEKVQFKGRVSGSEVARILMNARVLVSSQPSTVRASGGFPTKMGEYLASGVPALFTKVGENDKYVKDGKHLFFSQPNSPELFAEKLSYILDNYSEALKVAKNGKDYVFDHFSHIKTGKDLLKFLKTI